jgi:hypothetical protein
MAEKFTRKARKKNPEQDKSDNQKIEDWIKKNEVKKIASNVGGNYTVKSFFQRRKKPQAVQKPDNK